MINFGRRGGKKGRPSGELTVLRLPKKAFNCRVNKQKGRAKEGKGKGSAVETANEQDGQFWTELSPILCRRHARSIHYDHLSGCSVLRI